MPAANASVAPHTDTDEELLEWARIFEDTRGRDLPEFR